MKRHILERLQRARAGKRPLALLTLIESGRQSLIYQDQVFAADHLQPELIEAARKALAADRSGLQDTVQGRVFIHVFSPPLRMAIVGAVHICQCLVPMARLAGYEVIVIDPRRAWTSDARFPDVEIREQWPDQALTELALDARSALITLSHDPKIDDPALAIGLRSPVFYIGSLGSKRTHSARLERLRSAGFEERELDRIHGPIGLNIGAKSPAEIAISILAELTQALRT